MTITSTPCALEQYPLLANFISTVWTDMQSGNGFRRTDTCGEWRGLRFGALSVLGAGDDAASELHNELDTLVEVLEVRS